MHPIPRNLDRRGMTFLEIVAAAALLALLAGTIFGIFGFVGSSQSRDLQRLGAMEVCNRLMLAYLDDPEHMPDPAKTVEYGAPEAPLKYRWAYREEPLTVIEVGKDQRDQTRSTPLSNDRFRYVTIQAWLSEDSGGSRYPEGATPVAMLTRMLDPVMPRNADSYMNQIQDPTNFQRLINNIMGVQGGTVSRGGLQTGLQTDQSPRTRPGPINGGEFGPRAAFRQGRGGQGPMSPNGGFRQFGRGGAAATQSGGGRR
jgi:hypothetical protein